MKHTDPIDSRVDHLAEQISYNTMRTELEEILGWWTNWMVDLEKGGFYGRRDGNNILYAKADKSVILNARILWAFSAAAQHMVYGIYTAMARRAYNYFLQHFIDPVDGGVFWRLNANGDPVNTRKQIYGQAFAIYALSEYYALTNEQIALDLALDIFHRVESHSYDSELDGYIDAFDRSWSTIEDLRLSDGDLNAEKSMNTHLHLLEAYTNLLRVDTSNARVSQALERLIALFLDRFIDKRTHHLYLFFNRQWSSLSGIASFGHDIECSWLLTEAALVTGNSELIKRCGDIATQIAQAVLSEGMSDQGLLFNERNEKGVMQDARHWWVQAEAVIGFWNAWQISGNQQFQEAAIKTWLGIQKHFRDPLHGEWFWGIDRDNKPDRNQDKAGPWKAPYHNSRMCLEMMNRINQHTSLH